MVNCKGPKIPKGELESVIVGLENIAQQGEVSTCVKCPQGYVIWGWNFYNLCERCFGEWRKMRITPLPKVGPTQVSYQEFLSSGQSNE